MQPPLHVVLTDSDFADTSLETEALAPLGAVLSRHTCKTAAEVVSAAQGADALLVQWAPITREVMEQLPHLKAIARFGIGVDMIDVEAATTLGIAVCNTPEYCIEEVATHAMSLLLALARDLNGIQASVRAHRWGVKAVTRPLHNLSDQTIGLVGYGRIGRRMAQYARAFGLTVIVFDPYSSAPDIEKVSFEDLLSRSDYISIHSPLTAETRNLFDELAFAKMKPSACIINTSRGAIINSAALATALHENRIAAAAVDVLPVEPPAWDDLLLNAPNLTVTPHLSWYSAESPKRMRREAAEAIARLFQNQCPSGLLNASVLQSARWQK